MGRRIKGGIKSWWLASSTIGGSFAAWYKGIFITARIERAVMMLLSAWLGVLPFRFLSLHQPFIGEAAGQAPSVRASNEGLHRTRVARAQGIVRPLFFFHSPHHLIEGGSQMVLNCAH